MNALLLIAHGSRREASNEEVRELAKRLEGIAEKRFDRVVPAFLELAEPDIPTGIDLCEEFGAADITVVPYFLSAGRHVAEDIPKALEEAANRHPNLRIHLSAHIGQHADMPMMLLKASLGDVQALGKLKHDL